MSYMHARFAGDRLTFCGLVLDEDSTTCPGCILLHHQAAAQHRVWHRIVNCPDCLTHPEVKARIVEHALTSRP